MQQYLRARRSNAPSDVLPLHGKEAYSKTLKKWRPKSFWSQVLKFGVITLVLGLIAMGIWLSGPIMKAYKTATTPDHPSEMTFVDENGQSLPFPTLGGDASNVTLSVIVPAYNEEERMPTAMHDLFTNLQKLEQELPEFTWEVIIVDDGSKDSTAAIAQNFTRTMGSNSVRLLRLHQNSGKGAAVRKGMLRARGAYLLMADADGATDAIEVGNLLQQIHQIEENSKAIAIGSRAHMAESTVGGEKTVKRSALRRLLMWGFHTFMSVLIGGGGGIRDTQCGFKMFTKAAAQDIFSVLHIERWAFDVELVYLAVRKSIPMVEVPVRWQEMAGSKLDVVSATIQMARDIIVIRLCYSSGIWSDIPQLPISST